METLADPFSGGRRAAGASAQIVDAAGSSAPPGSICVTDDFAAALACCGSDRPQAGYVGELEARDGAPIGLFALRGGL